MFRRRSSCRHSQPLPGLLDWRFQYSCWYYRCLRTIFVLRSVLRLRHCFLWLIEMVQKKRLHYLIYWNQYYQKSIPNNIKCKWSRSNCYSVKAWSNWLYRNRKLLCLIWIRCWKVIEICTWLRSQQIMISWEWLEYKPS